MVATSKTRNRKVMNAEEFFKHNYGTAFLKATLQEENGLLELSISDIYDLMDDYHQHKQENEWISVDDRLPEEEKPVLVAHRKCTGDRPYKIHVGCLYLKEWICDYCDEETRFESDVDFYYVTHWKPLPKPPKQ